MTAALLDVGDIRERIKERQEAEQQAEIDYLGSNYKYLRPLAVAANGLIEFAQNREGRFMLGLHDLDIMTRGIGRGELAYVAGQSHQGKTQLVLNAIANSHDARILYFTPDEVAELVLAKLIGIRYGVPSDELESRIKAEDKETIDTVRRAASIDFHDLFVNDDALNFQQMRDAVGEAEDYWREKCDLVVIDYFELIRFAGDVEAKNATIKQWTKDIDAPVLCLRQSHMNEANRGKSSGFFAMRYGGHSEATFMFEVFRRRDDESLSDYERQLAQNEVTVKLTKNKRPPNKTGQFDLFLDPRTGLIRPTRAEDRVAAGAATSDALTAVKAVNR